VVAAGARVTVAAGVLIVIYVGANSRIQITRVIGAGIAVITVLVGVTITTLQVEIAHPAGREALIRRTGAVVSTFLRIARRTLSAHAVVSLGTFIIIGAVVFVIIDKLAP
jgi:hypothetical protein